MTTTRNFDPARQALAIDLHQKLAAVDITELPVMSRDRFVDRKVQAKLARVLFKRLGLKGISVTTPRYSMASVVEVKMPGRGDMQLDAYGTAVSGCEAIVANNTASQRMNAILLATFPQHDDRSDTQTDYFDSCWSISNDWA